MTQPFASAATLNSSIDSDKFFNDEKVYNKNICVANFFLQAHTHVEIFNSFLHRPMHDHKLLNQFSLALSSLR